MHIHDNLLKSYLMSLYVQRMVCWEYAWEKEEDSWLKTGTSGISLLRYFLTFLMRSKPFLMLRSLVLMRQLGASILQVTELTKC